MARLDTKNQDINQMLAKLKLKKTPIEIARASSVHLTNVQSFKTLDKSAIAKCNKNKTRDKLSPGCNGKIL